MRRWLSRHRAGVIAASALVAVVAVVLGLLVARRGGGPPGRAAAPQATSGSARQPVLNPLSGEAGVPAGPVIAVKVDNTAAGRPQWGLDRAAVVYVEQVEGGLTRLVAIYDAGRAPARVGPVRSVRGSDVELLAQYGPIALAFSGGAANPLAAFHASPLVDASPGGHAGAYSRLASRPAPYNLVVDVRALGRAVADAAGPRDVGFRWAATDPALVGAPPVAQFAAVVGNTTVGFRWDRTAQRWLEILGGSVVHGADGQPVSTSDVIVQFCRITVDNGDIDQAGSPAAYTHTVGSGPATLFRDGRRIDGTWTRPRPAEPTRYRTASGADMLLRPGGVWVVLAAAGRPLTIQQP